MSMNFTQIFTSSHMAIDGAIVKLPQHCGRPSVIQANDVEQD